MLEANFGGRYTKYSCFKTKSIQQYQTSYWRIWNFFFNFRDRTNKNNQFNKPLREYELRREC